MDESQAISVEIVYALPERQWFERLPVQPGTTVREFVRTVCAEGLLPEIDSLNCAVGIFGKVVPDDRVLCDGDRVEIYRPLINDPREQRRAVAAQGGSMGKRPD